jgi:signal transduction histidine kinase/CheY-like chemotaxis protein
MADDRPSAAAAPPPGTVPPPASAPKAPSLARPLLWLAIGLMVAIVAATAQQVIRTRAAVLEETSRQMARLDMVFAEQTGRTVETVDLILRGAIDLVAAAPPAPGQPPTQPPAQPPTQPPGTPADIDAALRHNAEGVRQMTEVTLADTAGTVLHTSRPGRPATLSPAARSLLDDFVAQPVNELRFSIPERDASGVWAAWMARPILDGAKVTGIALAGLNLRYFEEFYRAVELTENGAIVLHRRDGTVLARFPHVDAIIGSTFADLPPFRDILSHAMFGVIEMDSPVDGSRRVLAIRALRLFPLAVNVSVDQGAVLATWRRQAWTFAAAAAGGCLLLAVLIRMLAQRSRQVEQLVSTTEQARRAAEAANASLRAEMGDRERAEAALRQAQRAEAIGQLTRGVAHDFNNLLTVLLGNIDLLSQNTPPETPLGQRLATMRAAAERGATLTAQLMAFARRQPLQPRAVDLNAIIRNMHDLMLSGVGNRVRIETDLAERLPLARVDPTQIELAILNLAINARDAMAQGGVLGIATRAVHLAAGSDTGNDMGAPAPGDYVSVAVSDTGSGMPPEVLARAFDPFFTTKGVGRGSGLGLSQVHGLAYQSDGAVRIDSEVGRGTTVTILLPRANYDVPASAERAPAAPIRRTGQGCVLLVDDDDAVRATTAAVLRAQGYAVTEAASADAALALLAAPGHPIDVLVTDVVMPDVSGPTLVRRARAADPDLPAVLITGYSDPADTDEPENHVTLVRKPFTPAALSGAIDTALAGRLERAD